MLGAGSAAWRSLPPAAVSFTSRQAAAGKEAYGSSLRLLPWRRSRGCRARARLAGERFALEWAGKGAGDLFVARAANADAADRQARQSPAETYADILAFMLQSNGVAAGETALPSNAAVLADLVIPRTRGSWSASAAPAPERWIARVSLKDRRR